MEKNKIRNAVSVHTGLHSRHGHASASRYSWYRTSAAFSPWRKHLRGNAPWGGFGSLEKICPVEDSGHAVTQDTFMDTLVSWDDIIPWTQPM